MDYSELVDLGFANLVGQRALPVLALIAIGAQPPNVVLSNRGLTLRSLGRGLTVAVRLARSPATGERADDLSLVDSVSSRCPQIHDRSDRRPRIAGLIDMRPRSKC